MQKLSISNILENIENEVLFEAVSDDYAFTLKIADYAKHICTAIHDGHQFRKSLWENCLHTEYERWYEEDPCTKDMIATNPIVIAGRDSRFEYDLNRDPDNAIYDDAWGKQLWKKPLSKKERERSLEKHRSFYQVIDALVGKIENLHGKAIVFDMHSYNWKRWDREVPTWNLGTSNIDNTRYGKLVTSWSKKLGTISLPNGIMSTSKINDTFQGNGHLLKHITEKFDNTLVLATEIAKVYCDELTGAIYPEVVSAVERELMIVVPQMVHEFSKCNL